MPAAAAGHDGAGAPQSGETEWNTFLEQLRTQAEITDFIENLGQDLVGSEVLPEAQFSKKPTMLQKSKLKAKLRGSKIYVGDIMVGATWKGWCGDRQGLSHPNVRFMESLQRCMKSPDPRTLEIHSTPMVPVPWWEHEKIERVRRVLGVDPPVEQGPCPNYDVALALPPGAADPHLITKHITALVPPYIAQHRHLCSLNFVAVKLQLYV